MTTSLQCVCEYHGFDIIIPNNNTLDKMHIYIERKEKDYEWNRI